MAWNSLVEQEYDQMLDGNIGDALGFPTLVGQHDLNSKGCGMYALLTG